MVTVLLPYCEKNGHQAGGLVPEANCETETLRWLNPNKGSANIGTRARFVPKSGIRPPAVEDGMTADPRAEGSVLPN